MTAPVELPKVGKLLFTRAGRAFQVCRRNERHGTFKLKSVELGVVLRRRYHVIDIEVGGLLLRRPRRRS